MVQNPFEPPKRSHQVAAEQKTAHSKTKTGIRAGKRPPIIVEMRPPKTSKA